MSGEKRGKKQRKERRNSWKSSHDVCSSIARPVRFFLRSLRSLVPCIQLTLVLGVVTKTELGVLRRGMIQMRTQAREIQGYRSAQPSRPRRMIRQLLSRQRMDQNRMWTTVQHKPGITTCEILPRTPHFITSNGVRTTGGSVDTVFEGHDLEEPFTDKFEDSVAEFDSGLVRGLVVLEPVEMEVELLNLVVVVGLQVGRGVSVDGIRDWAG